jgi:3-isopropylmalate dehydratase small subunit
VFDVVKEMAALGTKALQATGITAKVAELFARPFYRKANEIGL